MTPIKKFQVTFDCAEPERLARFWCEVLGYVVPPPPGLVGEERLAALEAECARLVPLGAVHVRTLYDGNDSCIPMLDIEGNEFCID